MLTIDKRWACWEIAHNDHYIATVGAGVTIRSRTTLELVHHFTGIRWIHGAIFVSNDVLMVFTGEQKIFLFQISQRKLLWAVPRPRELDSTGDMCCCHIFGTEKIACIAQGRKSMDEHFLLLIDWQAQEICIQRISDCYRVVSDLVWTQQFGVTFLSKQAKGDNRTMLFKIHQIANMDTFSILYDGESTQKLMAYSGNYLFMADYSGGTPKASVYPLKESCAKGSLKFETSLNLPLSPVQTKGPVGYKRVIFPRICWIDEGTGLLVACNDQEWVGVYDFLNEKMLFEYQNSKVVYGKLLDGRLLMGCAPGFSVEPIEAPLGTITEH